VRVSDLMEDGRHPEQPDRAARSGEGGYEADVLLIVGLVINMETRSKMIVTVDGAVTVDGTHLVLIRRAKPPFQDKLVLPGGHVDETDATLVDACVRELAEEIGLSVTADRLSLLTVLNEPGADPRYPIRVSVVFHANIRASEFAALSAGSDAASLELIELATLDRNQLGFDHYSAVLALRERLANQPVR